MEPSTGEQLAIRRETFGKSRRVRSPRDFQRIRRQGRRVSSALATLHYARQAQAQAMPPGDMAYRHSEAHPVPSRAGFSVSKRVGGAVVRNRVKRRMREIVRQMLAEVAPGWDLVFVARAPAAEAEYEALAQDIAGLLRRAKLLAADNH